MTYSLYQQDCLEWMSQQANDSIDTIIFSPPYNKKGFRGGTRTSTALWSKANIDYGIFDDNMPEQVYQQWQIEIVNECHRVIKPTGSIFYQHKIRNWDRKGSHPMEWLNQVDAQFYQEIIWHRKSTLAMDLRYLFTTTERIYWFCKNKPQVFKQRLLPEFRGDVWVIPPQKGSSHPAPFPEQLAENCLVLTMDKDNVVYDPFAGSGTTLAVAQRLGFKSIGTEIDPDYCAMIHERLK